MSFNAVNSEANGTITSHHRNDEPMNPSLKGIKYVIFPNNRYAQIWDFVMILSIWYYAFYIPFHFGISGGYYTVFYTWFTIFNTGKIVDALSL